MSGLILVWNRDGAPTAGEDLGVMQTALAHRAVDGTAEWLSPDGSLALAHLHFWTTPEELGEHQPLVTDELVLAFDGRVDNRSELAAALGLDAATWPGMSDAALVLRAFSRWGEACFERLLGPFAAVVVDRREGRVVLARDALGQRTLAWFMDARRLVVASEPYTVARHPAVPDGADEVWWAHYYAVRAVGDGRTRFAAVRELMPAHTRVVDSAGSREQHYWQPDPVPRLRYRRNEDYAEHFLAVMQRAVARRMRTVTRPAVLMSGGLDSTTIAALAAAELPAPERLRTYSYVFDELADCDERPYMAPMIEAFGLDAVQVAADDAWALSRLDEWPHNPNEPEYNCYRDLMERIFDVIQADGLRVVLAGYGADELYGGLEYWLRDLLADRRYAEAWRQLLPHFRRLGPRQVLASQSVRRAAAAALAAVGLRRRSRPAPPSPWLTPWSAALVSESGSWPPWAMAAGRPNQHRAALGPDAIAAAVAGGYHAHRRALEVRQPFRDREVVEFFLQLPAYQLYADGQAKSVARQAMLGRLPETVRQRSIPTSFDSLYALGVKEKHFQRVRTLLAAADDERARFVSHDWLSRVAAAGDDEYVQSTALWRCLARAIWVGQSTGDAARSPRVDLAPRGAPTVNLTPARPGSARASRSR